MAVVMVQGADLPENPPGPEFAVRWAPLPNPGPPSVNPEMGSSVQRGVVLFLEMLLTSTI